MFPNTFIFTKSDDITIDELCTTDTTLYSDSISAQEFSYTEPTMIRMQQIPNFFMIVTDF